MSTLSFGGGSLAIEGGGSVRLWRCRDAVVTRALPAHAATLGPDGALVVEDATGLTRHASAR